MQDLLGIKYYLTNPIRENDLQMEKLPNMRLVHDGIGWYKIYENSNYLARAWMFDKAYVVPDNAAALALLNSRWFTASGALIMERGDLPANPDFTIEELPTYVLPPTTEVSSGGVIDDQFCAEPRRYLAYWGQFENDWQRYALPPDLQPGRYLLSAEYSAPEHVPAPVLRVEVRQAETTWNGESTALPRASGFSCAVTRTGDLGVFDLKPGGGSITLTSLRKTEMGTYGLTLIRLPDQPPATATDFQLRDYDVSANRYSFTVEAARPGLVLINDSYYPGWRATVDGQPAEILRADSLFRAVSVSAGTHRIEMKFIPRHFWWGVGASLLTLGGLVIYLRRGRRS
jgi:hypothetical protein